MAKPIDPAAPASPPIHIVINNLERLEMIYIPKGAPGEGELLVLMPGVNLVDPERLKACRTNPKFNSLFSTKIPRHVAEEARSTREGQPILELRATVASAAPLAGMPEEEAVDLVKFTTAVDILRKLRKGIDPTGILAAEIVRRERTLETGIESEAA